MNVADVPPPHDPPPGGLPAASSALDREVARAQAELIYDRSRLSNYVALPFGLVVCWVLSDAVPLGTLALWYAAKLAGVSWRLHLDRARRRAPDDPERWLWRMQAALLFDALVYSLIGAMAPVHDMVLTSLMLATIVGVAASGLIVLGTHFRTMLSFVVPVLIPNILEQLSLGTHAGIYAGIACTFFLTLALNDGRKAAAHTEEMLRIRFSMDELAGQRARALALAERHSAAKSEFLANMSHEMRTPLHAILSFSGLARKRIEQPDIPRDSMRTYLSRIDESGRRLLKLLNDLLDLSRFEAGMMQYEFGRHDVARILRTVVAELELVAQDKGVLLVNLAAAGPVELTCDPAKVEQVNRNLIANAIKFTPAGRQVRVSVESYVVHDPGQVGGGPPRSTGAKIVVSDDGVGIPAEERALVFDKFVQSSRTKTGAGGTGLGLAIVRQIVSDHLGSIEIRDSATGGAEFVVLLPGYAAGPVTAATVASL